MTKVLLFTFSPPLFFCFSCLIFFLLLGIYVVGFSFGKAFRILGLDERKGRWIVEQDFQRNFKVSVKLFFFFAFLSGVLDWIMLILFIWFERSLHSAQVSGKSCHWPLKLMMSQAVEGTWIRTGGYGGKWVKRILKNPYFSIIHEEAHEITWPI